ncbi:YkgJ family cysteine cluster protein [Novosphingobium sp. ERN07]|uniref:YkgJ family cysteine cluster protein n=1 Tax=Novosphingobium sp. ERN07 TaxID=2726187 RepID=UPI0014574632|nr:YkgJ family cysteine cluster protein [Novosphingobium sp. ERN07]NLR69334.1 YkgJ family cysteine cluster protein [Novosphingobium sp. ERN07]
MEITFDCTRCGRCCHDLRLTLSVDEARAWAGNGHQVDLLAEGWAWPDDADETAPETHWRKATTIPVMVGDVPFRINLRLVARHEGPCPHLLPDMRCGNYEARPRICRIYPLESRPFEAMIPEKRHCPPEAWAPDLPVLERDGKPATSQTAAILNDHRQATVNDLPLKARLAAALDFTEAALAGEGLASCEPAPAKFLAALNTAERTEESPPAYWSIVTNRETTRAMLADLDCPVRLVATGYGFLSAFADEL